MARVRFYKRDDDYDGKVFCRQKWFKNSEMKDRHWTGDRGSSWCCIVSRTINEILIESFREIRKIVKILNCFMANERVRLGVGEIIIYLRKYDESWVKMFGGGERGRKQEE